MKPFDPYDELGIERDADDASVKSAYRRMARTLHPDAGGSAEAFGRINRARDILLDPDRRRRFDGTGSVDDVSPDNFQIKAMEVIIAAINARVSTFVTSGFNPAFDPTSCDLPSIIRREITDRIKTSKSHFAVGRKHVAALRKVRDRFSRRGNAGGNFIKSSLEHQAATLEQKIAELEQSIDIEEKALELLADFDFQFDPTSFAPTSTVGGFVVMT